MAELMRTHRANLPDDRSRDNSQVSYSSDESDLSSNSDSNSDSDEYLSADNDQNESESSSNSDSDSDSDDYPSGNGQGSNLNNNQSNEDNQSNSESPANHESNQPENDHLSDTGVSQSDDQIESCLNPDKNLLTDDAPDLSDTLHMFFPDSPIENKSTIDFVLQKQQEEMPDIMDSDGGE